MDARNPNAVVVGSLELFSTQIPVRVSKSDSSVTAVIGTQKYKVWVYELSLQPTPTEDQEPPTEAVSSSSTNDQELQMPVQLTIKVQLKVKGLMVLQFPQGNRY